MSSEASHSSDPGNLFYLLQGQYPEYAAKIEDSLYSKLGLRPDALEHGYLTHYITRAALDFKRSGAVESLEDIPPEYAAILGAQRLFHDYMFATEGPGGLPIMRMAIASSAVTYYLHSQHYPSHDPSVTFYQLISLNRYTSYADRPLVYKPGITQVIANHPDGHVSFLSADTMGTLRAVAPPMVLTVGGTIDVDGWN